MTTRPNAVVMISGPSGVGKTTLVGGLIGRWPDSYVRPLSYTSRARRAGEGDSEYQFVDKATIMLESQRGNLANLDFVYENLYAIKKSSIDDALEKGLSPIKEIHPSNHHKLRNLYPQCVAVLVLPDTEPQGQLVQDARQREDADFYSRVNVNDFDVVVRSSRTLGLEAFVEDAHYSIQAYLAGYNRFPRPGEIDRINAEGYSKVAGRFTTDERPTTANFHDLSLPFFAKAISNLANGAKCLEVGPGQGWLRKSFRWPVVQYSAADVAAKMIATLHFEAKEEIRVAASARAMPFRSSSFDCVFSSLGDGYCYPTALAEIRRVLKRSGLFYFSAPSGVWANGLRAASTSDRTHFLLPDGDRAEVFSFTFSLTELGDLFERCGFRVILAEEVSGNKLSRDREISKALSDSARRLSIDLALLPIINTVAAIKD